MKAFKIILLSVFLLLIVVIQAFSIRGSMGNPTPKELQRTNWRDSGVFEVSPERGRYGLLYSIVEDKSFYFSVDIARFILPDLGYKNGNYVSLFAPAVSFIAIPGYLIGKYFGMAQVGAFAIISLFAFINFLLIKNIATKLGAKDLPSWIGAIVFLFATPAYAYSVNLYQHQISTFLILSASYLIIATKKVWPLFFVYFLCAMSIPVDYPNLILMFPIGVYGLQRLVSIEKIKSLFSVKIHIFSLLVFLGIVAPLLFFGWFNLKSYGNALQFSGTVGGVHEIDNEGKPGVPEREISKTREDLFEDPEKQQKSALKFFKPRNILNGMYIHLLSPDRGILYFSPIMVFGIFGIYFLYKKNNKFLPMLIAIVGANLILYSMWGDPWGGWSFGSRYMIPSYAIVSIFIAIAITEVKRKWIFLLIFYPILIYSAGINTLGAITTSANPPKIEAVALESISGRSERYSFDRNWEYLRSGHSKALIYKEWAYNYISTVEYFYLVLGLITALSSSLIIGVFLDKNTTS